MYSKLPFTGERGSALWPLVETTAPAVSDGPLAVISAVLLAARRHKLKFALWMLACIGVAAAYAYTATPSYTATATLLLEPRRQAPQASQDSPLSSGFDVSRAESELQVLRSERLLTHVFGSLNLANHPEFKAQPPGLLGMLRDAVGSILGHLFGSGPAEPQSPQDAQQQMFENFVQHMTVRRVGQSYVAEISYTANDPTLARRVANAAASAYLLQSIAAKADAAKNGAEFLQGRLNALSAQARSASAAVAAGSLPEAPTPDADARVIGAALQPLKPSAPRKALILSLGAMIGLVGGFLGVAIGQALDRKIRTPQDIAQHLGLSCLTTLPEIGVRSGSLWRRRAGPGTLAASVPGAAFAKGIRKLRASMQLAVSGRTGDVTVALVGCAPGVGTSLIGFHLACLIRDSGRPVTLIDGDVHGTAMWPPAGRNPQPANSLAELLHDSRTLDEANFLDRGGISMIPARSTNAALNKRAYLGAPALQQVMEHLRRTGVVILDLPPLTVAMEACAAAKHADAVVVVAEAGHTTVDQLADVVTSLKGVGANVIGVALNRSYI
ncbi:Wzz/FepE/Etk N-terminal domain-containing protein [Methylobacterium sp. 77]|uniref:Wzz/FepE/Etk N-terminal domain-containing protein n=1 Tax=Methylobacterium sp. 77 TaxID=1101192 RepID=UPI00037A5C78|nr:Wzz/FepE/Etk N-terminal domain-containing protein [Methylobacterium sp. 77]